MRRIHAIAIGAATVAAIVGVVAVSKSKPTPKPDGVTVQGEVIREVISGGKVVEAETVRNKLVAGGIRLLIGQLVGDSSAPFDTAAFIAVGNGTSATDTSMTALQGDTVTWGNVDSLSYAANYVRWCRTATSAVANHSVSEIAVFADSAGTMLDRAVVNWGTKTTADTWKFVVRLRFW